MILTLQKVIEADFRIRGEIRETPVEYSYYLSKLSNCRVYLKLEHLQHTGSFKVRGALNKIYSMTPEQLKKGVIAASTGNHGLGVCYSARQIDTEATIYLPHNISRAKLEMIRERGGNPVLHGENCLDAEKRARQVAESSGRIFISPYNDLEVIAGQGTIGLELARQTDHIDAVFSAVGGGGLISGIATYLKSIDTKTQIIGCWPENSRVLYECLHAGRIIEFPEEPTLSESTAGGVEEDSVTFPLCQELIDNCVLVSEAEIDQAMRLIAEHERWIVEGSAGVAVAAFLKECGKFAEQDVVIVLCGRNTALF
ncbi:MAG: threonine/serine dehydratase [Acidobacteria bacterium]|nr:threonine/serine dehydratase [Acidobacteriota bacterium]